MSNFTRSTLTLPTRESSVFKRLLSVIFLMPAAVFLSAWSFQDGEEKVTIKGDNVPLVTVFKTIKKQTGYSFFYAADYVNDMKKVTVDVKNTKVEDVLRKVLGGDYVWVYNENAVSITKKKEEVRRNSFMPIVADSSVTQITVSGLVTDAKGTPIPGATVMVKGTKDGSNTDEDGKFSLPGVATNAVLVISSVGFERREMQVKGKTILARLNINVNDLDEAVVVAYNTTTQRTNTGAVTVVKGKQIESLPNRSFDRSLQGQIPGLLVTSGNGQPGGGISNMVLRGIGTGTDVVEGATIRNPLIIIDGIQVTQDHLQWRVGRSNTPVTNPMAQINPSDIESITVLKDASAIALYGSRASNGVILVTTKQGKTGKTKISFRHQTDIAQRVKGKIKTLNQQEYLDLLFESYRNQNASFWTDERIKSDLISKFPVIVKSPGDTSFYQQPNWYDELFTNHATTVSSDLSISGGNDFNTYYLNFEYTTQNGVIKNTGYDRASIRYNFQSKPAKWINLGVNSTFSYNKQTLAGVYEDAAFVTGLPYTLSPLLPVRLTNNDYYLLYRFGAPGGGDEKEVSNPVATMEYNINSVVSYRGLGNVYAEVSLLPNLKFRSNLGLDFMHSNGKEKVDPRLTEYDLSGDSYLEIGGRIMEQSLTRTTLTTTNTLRYIKSFGARHNLNLILGQEAQMFNNKTVFALGTGLSSPSYEQVSNANNREGTSMTSKERLVSYFGQANYSYAERYLVSVSGRKDGSSKFGEKQKYNNYWSAGAGWVVTEEPFMKRSSSWLNYLKVRGSVGIAGNAASIAPSTRFDLLNVISSPVINPAVRTDNAPGNPYIKSEKTFNQDIGLELNIFNRMNLSVDLYKRKISDLLYETNLPGASGYQTVLANIGDMDNKGVEVSLSFDLIKNTVFRWNMNANWSANKNKLIKANVPLAVINGKNLTNKEGENFNSFYLVKWAGVNPDDGTPQWLDLAGKASSTYTLEDRTIVGKPQPDGFGGVTQSLNYKNIELVVFFYYQYGFQIYDKGAEVLLNDGAINPYINQFANALDRWRKPGDIAANPRRVLTNTDGGNFSSSRYLFDGDFIRLKNVSLTYTCSQRLAQKIKLANLQLYMQASNLALWTKYPGIDPENANLAGESGFAYPQQKSFSIGLNATF